MSDPRMKNPRCEVQELIAEGNLKELMLRAGALHNHFCPGLAMGIMAAGYAMKEIGAEPVVAIVNNMSCWVDGIQYLCGASAANRSLILDLTGESTVTIVKKSSGEGFQISATDEYSKRVEHHAPGFSALRKSVISSESTPPEVMKEFREKAISGGFSILEDSANELFTITPVSIEIPNISK